jgi:hypothetical protein
MKRLTPIIVLFVLWTIHANSATVQVGSGTSTNSYLPVYSCYNYNYSQQIYLQSEIAAGGGISGPVTKVRFYYNNGGTTYSTWLNWTIYMGNTIKTSFSGTADWEPVASMTQVFSGSIPTPVTGTWLEITLTTPFNYTGGNIIVAVDENSSGYSCTASWRSFASGSNRGILYYSDDTNPDPAAPPAANYGPNANIAQVQFDMATNSPELFAAPFSLDFGYVPSGNVSAEHTYLLSGSNLTPASGNVTITPPANFEISLTSGSGFSAGPVNVPYSGGVLASTTIYSIFKPTGAPAFYTGEIANTGGGAPAENVAVIGNSFCGILSDFPYTQEFTDAIVPPVCWSETITNADFNWKPSTTNPGWADVEFDEDLDAQDEWLISPAFDLTMVDNPRLTFNWLMSYYWSVDPYDNYDLNCLISTDGGVTWPIVLWNEEGEGVFENFIAYTETIDLADYSNESNVRFAWQYVGADGAQAGIDSVVIDQAPSCPAPTTPLSSNISFTGADLSWTDADGSNWDLYIVPAGDPAPGASSTPTVDDISDNPYTWTGGQSNTAYDWYVRTDCRVDNSSDISTWTGSAQFTTNPSPVIVYTPLLNTTLLTARTLTAEITGENGVPVSGSGLPVCYWRINNGSYNSSQGIHVGGDQYEFVFGSGVTAGNVVYYYIAAQDMAAIPNVKTNPSTGSTGFSANPPACSTPPSSPSSYQVTAGLSGTKTIGSSGDYTNLTGENGLFKAVNNSVLTGNLTVLINNNLTEEGTYALNQWVEEQGNDFTITIKPNVSVSPTISGSLANNALIRFNGVSRVTIDGSNNGTTTRNLTITNSSATSPNVFLFGSVGAVPFLDVTLKNCIVTNGTTTSTAIIVSDATTPGNSGYFDNLTLQNNDIRKCYIGFYINAIEGEGTNVFVLDNKMNNTGVSNLRNIGIYMQGVDNATVAGNLIGNFVKSNAENDYGIWLASGCKTVDVYNNSIDNLGYSGSAGYGAKGIMITTAMQDAEINIYNNLISNITGDGDDYTNAGYYGLGYNPAGIFMFTYQSGISVYHNSVYLSGNTLNYHANSMSMGICIGDSTTADIRNNLIVNNLGLVGTTGHGACGIYVEASADQLTVIDHNNYYANPTGSGVKALGKIGGAETALTLADWQTATGQDVKSISQNPLFVSTTNLRLQAASPAIGRAIPISIVVEDYDKNPRHIFKPTMGAFDYVPSDFYMWTGSVNTDWNTSGNWSPNGVPGINNDAGIPPVPAGGLIWPVVPNTPGPFSVDELFVAPGASITVPNGATLNITNTNP